MPKKKRARRKAQVQQRRLTTQPPSATYDRVDTFMRKLEGGESEIQLPGYWKGGVKCPEVLLEGPAISRYADYVSMREDLDHVVMMCEHGVALANDPNFNEGDRMVGMRATWEAAIIAYGRAFVSGVSAVESGGARTRFPAGVLGRLDEAQSAVHKHTMELRNKHVGHRVNKWTQVKMTAVLNPLDQGDQAVLQLGTQLLTMMGGGEQAAQLREVATILRDGLVEEMNVLQARLERELRAAPASELYAAAQAGQVCIVTVEEEH